MSENYQGLLPVGLRACRVISVTTEGNEGFYEVVLDAERPVTARCLEAALTQGALQTGDTVLAAQGSDRRWYVLGRVAGIGSAPLTVTREGANTVVGLTSGHLVLRAPASVRLEATDAQGAVGVRASSVSVETTAATLRADDARVEATRVHTEASRVRTVAGVVEVDARRILERAQDFYQEARDQFQVKARRVRTVTEDAWTVLGQRLKLRARGDVKVEGEKIYLG